MKILKNNKVILIFVILFLLFIGLIMPTFKAYLSQVSKTNFQSLDMRFSYDSATVEELFVSLGQNGRAKLSLAYLTLDLVYPLIYSSLLFLMLSKLLSENNQKLKYLPIIALGLDYVENLIILIMLNLFPAINSTLVVAASTATSLKWLFLGLSLIAFLMLIIKKVISPKSKD